MRLTSVAGHPVPPGLRRQRYAPLSVSPNMHCAILRLDARVAISNHRHVTLDRGQVTFSWRVPHIRSQEQPPEGRDTSTTTGGVGAFGHRPRVYTRKNLTRLSLCLSSE
jgi:hypothetical protein